MIRRPPRSTHCISSAASDVYKRQYQRRVHGMFVVLWFLMIRPQMKKAKEHKALLGALAKGDEVVTQGGIVGKIIKVGENYVTVEIAEGTEVVVQKPSIGLVLPKGTLKSLQSPQKAAQSRLFQKKTRNI
eukprot:TRINITY_DN2203_c0_g1_i3.p1 TRINITY_DN2203_c0_g1~~TRINITY_DN2203_c0_g1_i3.p1  ORF type:complete len:130 (-),score=42.96 TRINITY_DN2203_c0_g1_i3:178-567(-)